MKLFRVRVWGTAEGATQREWHEVFVAATDIGRAATRAEHWAFDSKITPHELTVQPIDQPYVEDYT